MLLYWFWCLTAIKGISKKFCFLKMPSIIFRGIFKVGSKTKAFRASFYLDLPEETSSSIFLNALLSFLSSLEPLVILHNEICKFLAISRWGVPLSISRTKSQRVAKSFSSERVNRQPKKSAINAGSVFFERILYNSFNASSWGCENSSFLYWSIGTF